MTAPTNPHVVRWAFIVVAMALCVPCTFAESSSAIAPHRQGVVALDGHALHDDGGHFLGLGVTYFRALERCKHDRDRYRSDLAYLAAQRFEYIRILSMVGWYEAWEGMEIAPVPFTSRSGKSVAAWPDYWEQLAATVDIAYDEFGVRTQITIFADAQLMPEKPARLDHLKRILDLIQGREHKVILLEVANEAWQNGFPGDMGLAELREYGDLLAAQTEVLVALSDTADNSVAALQAMYAGSAADIATEHFGRDSDPVEGSWLFVRAPWSTRGADGIPPISNNEPIGPGSSVRSENDPVKLVCAGAFSFIAQLPMHVFHSEAGVFGQSRFEDQPGIEEMAVLKKLLPADLPNWNANDGLDAAAPFTVYVDGLPDVYWPDVQKAASGVVRNVGAVKDDSFVALPMGILAGGVVLEARRDLFVEVFDPLTGIRQQSQILRKGQPFTLPQGPGAYILKGRFTGAGGALARSHLP